MTTTSIGARRRRFVLEEPCEEPDGAGGVVRGFRCIGHVWGSLEAVSSGDASRDLMERRELAPRFRVRLRWRDGIDGRHRLREGGRVFAILAAVDPDGYRRELAVLAQEVTP